MFNYLTLRAIQVRKLSSDMTLLQSHHCEDSPRMHWLPGERNDSGVRDFFCHLAAT